MTDSKEDGLLPCPFCGGRPRVQDYRAHEDQTGETYGFAAVECHCIGSSGGLFFHFDTLEECFAAWNRRASSPPVGGSGEVDIDVDELAGEIRYVDGEHKLGAGALAEALAPYLRLVVRSALAAPVPNGVPEGATHRHRKRDSEYVLIGIGKMQAENWYAREVGPATRVNVDMREVAIYRSATDPTEIWVRPREEFEDGRFEVLAVSPVTPEGLSGGDDTARLDWLETMTVNVRTPLLYGSHDLFWANPDDSFEGQIGPSDIRAQIDNAMTKSADKTV